jgi:UMF1 family MFS transporter
VFFLKVGLVAVGISGILWQCWILGSIVFYNSYLPEIAYPEQHDRVSAKGFMYGYFGSLILLVLV